MSSSPSSSISSSPSTSPSGGDITLLDGLAAYYNCDEASGDAIDIHSTNDLTVLVGAPGSAAGALNTARKMNASDTGTIYNGSLSGVSATGSWHIAGWFKIANAASDNPPIFTFSDWQLYYDTTDSRLVLYEQGVAHSNPFTGATLSSDTWAFIALGWDGSTAYLRLNASNYTQTPGYGNLSGSAMQIAAQSSQNLYADEVGIWSRVLTDAELTELYNSGTPPGYGSF